MFRNDIRLLTTIGNLTERGRIELKETQMDKVNEIVDSILNNFTLPAGDTVLPCGQTVRYRVKCYLIDLVDRIESELESVE